MESEPSELKHVRGTVLKYHAIVSAFPVRLI